MDNIRDKLERYEPDEETKILCTKYIYFLLFYNSYIFILFIYTFFTTPISSYGWLFFMNLYFCIFPVFAFMGNSYIPSLLRFYNWMLFVSSIISIFIVLEAIFTFKKIDLYIMICYATLTCCNTFLCWHVTQSIFGGVKAPNSVLDTLRPHTVNQNEYSNKYKKKDDGQKKFIGKGRSIKDSNYIEV
ncbi:conserved Plasmodium membrane protein, unknown function [Plasmodium reichenowi]|uniref:DUF7641 domain-containing protein n=2 Tax=Plasmodium reichenowi TaxID=5854 RepID=A0A060RW73_PLARE|nr:conserved Plasmodium membrane protein, unknown function [Plasmodium reichenowi]